jgi:hypothetical protein
MPRLRAIVQIPPQLAAAVDKIAGPGHRSEFATQVLEREIRRLRLLHILENPEPLWKNKDHPEMDGGSDAWVRKIRRESERRLSRRPKRG